MLIKRELKTFARLSVAVPIADKMGQKERQS